MRGKIALLTGGAVGYVLGTRAGRERYEQIMAQAQSFWNNPKVQEKASQAQDLAKEKAPLLKDKVSSSSDTSSSSDSSSSFDSSSPLDTPSTFDSPSSTSTGTHAASGGVGDVGGVGGETPSTPPYPTSASTGLS